MVDVLGGQVTIAAVCTELTGEGAVEVGDWDVPPLSANAVRIAVRGFGECRLRCITYTFVRGVSTGGGYDSRSARSARRQTPR
jgi:hypothetical protein